MAIYSAPLGAFLPWRHIVTLTVPSLRPGAKMLVETIATKTRPLPLGRIDRIPPSSPHWVGNINIFVNNHRVERHLARGLRVQPGKLNRTFFMVGNGNLSDAYAFRIHGDGMTWESRLFAMPLFAGSLVRTSEGNEIEEDHWIEASRARFVTLQFRPPADSRRGSRMLCCLKRLDRRPTDCAGWVNLTFYSISLIEIPKALATPLP